jgi:N-acetylglucosamine kinase-like BadF-type ATPase
VSSTLVVGVDAGGTTTRCLVATLDGAVVGRGEAGGASQRSSTDRPADPLAAALRSALSGVDHTLVAVGVIGVAGAGQAGRAVAQDAADTAWRSVGLPGDVTLVTDLEVAFAAGTASGTGLLLLSGTGAVAAAFRGGTLHRRCDGYGWLLGDEGSAVWIGREGLRNVLAALDGRGEPTSLTPAVSARLLGAEPVGSGASDREAYAQAIVGAAFAMPPAHLGRLAPLVSAAAESGDPVARAIIDTAVDRLIHALDTVARDQPGSRIAQAEPGSGGAEHPRHGPGAVVLAGSVLLSPGPVSTGVRARVRERFGSEPASATDGAAGAAAIAIGRLHGTAVAPGVHARLTGR